MRNKIKEKTRKNKRKSSKIKTYMHGQYRFDTIFYFNPINGTIMPRYKVLDNGVGMYYNNRG